MDPNTTSIVALVIALGSLLLSYLIWRRQPALIRRQLEEYERMDEAARRADLDVWIERTPNNTRLLVVDNNGDVPARDVDVSAGEPRFERVMGSLQGDAFPVTELPPHSTRKAWFLHEMGPHGVFHLGVLVEWTDPDGSRQQLRRDLPL